MIQIKRAYDPPAPGDGTRFLVDALWPRGIKKEDLRLDGWLKDAAPSSELRRWFGHDPDRWAEFQQRYFAELDDKPEALQPLRSAAEEGDVTLIYGARDTEHNNAVALLKYLEKQRNGP
jgi:uncharacterized protein YeaO (DUF488 family)